MRTRSQEAPYICTRYTILFSPSFALAVGPVYVRSFFDAAFRPPERHFPVTTRPSFNEMVVPGYSRLMARPVGRVRRSSSSHGSGRIGIGSGGLQNLPRRVGVELGDPTRPDPIRPDP